MLTQSFKPILAALAVALLFAPAQAKVNPQEIEKIKAALPDKAPAKPKAKRKVLIFSKTNGFRHGSIAIGAQSLTMLGAKTGAYTAVHSEDEAMFEKDTLNKFDLVIMLNTTGEIFKPHKNKFKNMTADEKNKAYDREDRLKANLVAFVKSGKGLAGTHSATDTYKRWTDYNEMMGGAFAGHPWHMDVPIANLAPNHPLNKVFAKKGFSVKDEIYQFRDDTNSPKDRKILLSLDPKWDGIKKGKRKDGLFAISWIRTYGDGRTFYCSLGHRNEIYYNPVVLKHYLAGFQYAMGDLDADATPVSTIGK